MRAKVPKCRVLAIRREKVLTDPQLLQDKLPIPSVADEPIKFLGMPIHANFDNSHHKQGLKQKLKNLLSKVDKSLLLCKQN